MKRKSLIEILIPFALLFLAACRKDYAVPLMSIGDPAGRPGPGNYLRRIQVDARVRSFELHVPPSYDGRKPLPVVLVFHGGGGSPGTARVQSGMDAVADQEGFIVVYPAGTSQTIFADRVLVWNAGGCCGRAAKQQVNDTGFIAALLDDLQKIFSVDSTRVFATGISNGAQMTYRAACLLSERFAAIAPIAAPMTSTNCTPARPVPLMHFHGLEDEDVPYAGGQGIGPTGFSFMSVDANMLFWARMNGCSTSPLHRQVAGQAVEIAYTPCSNDGEVILWLLKDGAHTWPGSSLDLTGTAKLGIGRGHVNSDINASKLMWAFFKRHSLPAQPASAPLPRAGSSA